MRLRTYKITRFLEKLLEPRISTDPSDWFYFLNESIQALHRSRGYVQSKSRYENISQKKTLDAAIRNLLLAADLVCKIPRRVRNANPDIPWETIAGYSRFLHFRYASNDFDTVWREVSEELPMILTRMMEMRDKTGLVPDPPPKSRKGSTT